MRRSAIQELADGAGISKGAFYGFFLSKEALYVEALQQVETEIRSTLSRAAAQGLRPYIRCVFETAVSHPIMATLADPTQFAWLMRGVPSEVVDANRARDDAWFATVLAGLQTRGEVRPDADPTAFYALAPAALALGLGQDLLGPQRLAPTLALLVDGICLSLQATQDDP